MFYFCLFKIDDIDKKMITNSIDREKLEAARTLIEQNDKFVIVCHTAPDGDAIGSSLALYHMLTEMGKQATVVVPDALPHNLGFLSGIKKAVNYYNTPDKAKAYIAEAEVIVCLDFNEAKRLGKLMSEDVVAATAKKIMIDHHLNPQMGLCDVTISHPEMAATCELMFQLFYQLGWIPQMTLASAEAIYTGMVTDTGNFSYNSNRHSLYIMVAELLHKGVNKDAIYDKIFKNDSENKIRLNGYAVSRKMTVYKRHQAAMIALTQRELNRHHYRKGDTEGLVNAPLGIAGITYSVFFREETEFIKVSLRSKGDFPVNKMAAEHFNGGGHLNASGGEFYGTLEEAMELFEKILPAYDIYLKKG